MLLPWLPLRAALRFSASWGQTQNGKVFVRSGAGIVADSVPESEYNECINKAKAVMNAVSMGQESI